MCLSGEGQAHPSAGASYYTALADSSAPGFCPKIKLICTDLRVKPESGQGLPGSEGTEGAAHAWAPGVLDSSPRDASDLLGDLEIKCWLCLSVPFIQEHS